METLGTPETITRQVDLDLGTDALWDAITDPEMLSTWLGDHVDLDVRPGGTGTVVDDGVTRHVLVDEVVARRELSFTWWEPGDPTSQTRVIFAVDPNDDGSSRLTITETMPAGLASARSRDEVDATMRWEVRVLSLWACTVAAALVR